MTGLELAVLLGCLLLLGGWLGQRTRVPTPLVLVVCGGVAGTVPAFADVGLPPSVVLLLFLPALLYWESSNISWREIRRNLGTIAASAVPLVLVSAAAATVIGTGFGLPVAVAVTLGAIVAPTDATAIASVSRRLPVRTLTVLRAESLINDGTALTLYALAVPAAMTGAAIELGPAALRFAASYLGGVAIGAAAALVVVVVRRRVAGTPLLENTVSVVTPFAAYLPAERAHVSGVLAVVTAGLVFSRFSPQLVTVRARTQVHGFWQITSWFLSGTLFVLVGFEARQVVVGIGPPSLVAVAVGVVLAVALIVVRLVWAAGVPAVVGWVRRRRATTGRRAASHRQSALMGWSGFRGAVSLAAALALPAGPDAFPDRGVVVTAVAVVVMVTLALQGLTYGAVLRWADVERSTRGDVERHEAEVGAVTAAVAALPELVRRLETPPEVARVVEDRLRHRLDGIRSGPVDEPRPPSDAETAESELERALIEVQRTTVVSLRDRGAIDDAVLHRLQGELDIAELRLLGPATED